MFYNENIKQENEINSKTEIENEIEINKNINNSNNKYDYKEIEYFYGDDFLKNTKKIESIKCYHCHTIFLKKHLDNLYLIKTIIKSQIFNTSIFNSVWYPLCSNCHNHFENKIILKF